MAAAPLTLFLVPSAVSAGGDSPYISIEIDPGEGPPGTSIAVSGECFENRAGEQGCDSVQLSLISPDDEIVGSQTVDADPGTPATSALSAP